MNNNDNNEHLLSADYVSDTGASISCLWNSFNSHKSLMNYELLLSMLFYREGKQDMECSNNFKVHVTWKIQVTSSG